MVENPTYKDVCTHKTGHAEAVQIQFDSNEVSYEQLLDTFWSIHNPTPRDTIRQVNIKYIEYKYMFPSI